MASFVYDCFLNDLINGDLDFAVDTFKVMLVTSAYTAVKATHDRRDDVTNEVAGTGYTAGGATATCVISAGTGSKIITLQSVSWAAATFTTAGAVIYKSRGGASSADELIAYLDFNGNMVSLGGTFAISSSVITIQN